MRDTFVINIPVQMRFVKVRTRRLFVEPLYPLLSEI